jgi:hypothetical protein
MTASQRNSIRRHLAAIEKIISGDAEKMKKRASTKRVNTAEHMATLRAIRQSNIAARRAEKERAEKAAQLEKLRAEQARLEAELAGAR